MPDFIAPYYLTVVALGCFGLMYIVQLMIADVAGLLNGHTAGVPPTTGHDDFLFRAVRAHANTTESVGAFILLAGFAILMQGEEIWVNLSALLFLVCRFVHMIVYYFGLRRIRSLAFGLGIFALLGLFIAGAMKMF